MTISQEPKSINRNYLYINWRGKTFIIDEHFVEELKKSLIEDGMSAEDVQEMTPEAVMKNLPMYEEIERLRQLEEMWDKQMPLVIDARQLS